MIHQVRHGTLTVVGDGLALQQSLSERSQQKYSAMFEKLANLTPNESKVFLTLANAEIQSKGELLSPTQVMERTGLHLSDVSHAASRLKERKVVEEDNAVNKDGRIKHLRLKEHSPEVFFVAKVAQSIPSPKLNTTPVREIFKGDESIMRFLHQPNIGVDYQDLDTEIILGTTAFLPSTFGLKFGFQNLHQRYLNNCDSVTSELSMHPDTIDVSNQFQQAVYSQSLGLIPLLKQRKLKFLPVQLGTRTYVSLRVNPRASNGRSRGKLFVVNGSSAFHFYREQIEREPRESLESPDDSQTLYAMAAEELERGEPVRVIGPSSIAAVFATFVHMRESENQFYEFREEPFAGVETLTITENALKRIPSKRIATLCLQSQDYLGKLAEPAFRVRLAFQLASELMKNGGLSQSLFAFPHAG